MNRQHRIVLGAMIAMALLGGSFLEYGNRAAADPCDVVSIYPGVCLDPGHGGPGACKLDPPCVNGDGEGTCGPIDPDTCLTEAWVNHEIVPLVADMLESDGFYVKRTRTTITEPMELQRRCDIANADPNVDVFVSVHHEGRPDVYDTRTFYDDTGPTYEWNHRLAQALAAGIDSQFHYGQQAIGEWKYVLRNTWMPATLTEASSLGHLSEALLMASEDDTHRRDEANGIRDGLFYYNWDTAPMFLTCRDRFPFSGLEFSWWPVEGADGYVVYVYENMFPFTCPSTEPLECYVVEAATSCIIFSVPGSPAVAVRPYVGYSEERRFVGGFSNCYGWWNDDGNCFPFSIDRMISIFTATGGGASGHPVLARREF